MGEQAKAGGEVLIHRGKVGSGIVKAPSFDPNAIFALNFNVFE